MCVLGTPFWNVPIDGGLVGEPEPKRRGFQVLSFPTTYAGGAESPGAEDALVVVLHRDELRKLVDVLEELFGWFGSAIQRAGWA
ncbi:MAG TPA: hypothetical protein VI356_25055 [Myxococcales bacterium]